MREECGVPDTSSDEDEESSKKTHNFMITISCIRLLFFPLIQDVLILLNDFVRPYFHQHLTEMHDITAV